MNADDILVFASNLCGRHGRRAQLHAVVFFGAQEGVAEGPTGRAYAIPLKNLEGKDLDLGDIEASVEQFLLYAVENPCLRFRVSRICEDTGYMDVQIAPLFFKAPPNCIFDPAWMNYGLKTWPK